MQAYLDKFLEGAMPIILTAFAAIVTALVAVITKKLSQWTTAQATTKAVNEAVAMIEKNMPAAAGADKLATVKSALPKATTAEIEVAVAKLVKPKKSKPCPEVVK